MRICIIADQIYKSGGIERVLSHRINYLIDKGYEVHLVTNENNHSKPYFDYHHKLIHHDLNVGFNKKNSLFSKNNLFLSIKYFLLLKDTIRKINADFIIVSNYFYEYYFLPFMVKKEKLIKEYHSSLTQEKPKESKIYKLKKYFSKFYYLHVFLSQEESLLSGFSNTIVVPNPVNEINFTPKELNERSKKIIAAGRLVELKGFERLIESWSHIAYKYPDWSLEIYGDGEEQYKNKLYNLIDKYSLKEQVFIYPSTNKIIEKMLDSRIYAMTSYTECFPMVLLEAMQTQTSILAFNCPTGPRSMIKNNKNGIIVEDGNLTDFSNQLENLILDNDYSQALANNGYEEVKKYDVDSVMPKWEDIFKKSKSNES